MQMRYVLFASMAALCLALAACSVTYGNKSVASPEVYGRLAPGKSSKADVYDALGQPSDVVTMKNGVLWTYRYRKAKNDFLGNIPLFGVGLIAGGKTGTFIRCWPCLIGVACWPPARRRGRSCTPPIWPP